MAAQPRFSLPQARSAFTRYRIMAWITGVMLLVLCLEMLLKYVFQAGGVDADGNPLPVIGSWVAMVHGFVYVVYLLSAFDMWARVRWGLGRMVVLALGGIVPVMSFVVEHVANGWFRADVKRLQTADDESGRASSELGGAELGQGKPGESDQDTTPASV